MYSCSSGDPEVVEPVQPPVQPEQPEPKPDKTAPVITLLYDSIDVYGGAEMTLADSTLFVGSTAIATWSDNSTPAKECRVQVTFGGSPIESGAILDKDGTLLLTVSDKAGNTATASVTLTAHDTNAPVITLLCDSIDVYRGAELTLADSTLSIGSTAVAKWSDDSTPAKECRVQVTLGGIPIESGTTLDKAGTLLLTVSDKAGNVATVSVTLTAHDTNAPVITLLSDSIDVYGGKKMTVDGSTLSIGSTAIAKWSDDSTPAKECRVQVTFGGSPIESGATLDKPGTLLLTVSDKAGNTATASVTLTAHDTNAPVITLLSDSIDVYGGKKMTVDGSTLSIGSTAVAKWSDDSTPAKECRVQVTFQGSPIENGTTLDKAGKLLLTVTDKAENTSKQELRLVALNEAPRISVKKSEVDVSGGKILEVSGNQMSIGKDVVMEWSDDHDQKCDIHMTLDGREVKSGTTLDKPGILKATVYDKDGESADAIVTLLCLASEYQVA